MYRVEGPNFVVGVVVHEGVITETAPLFKKFIGQPWRNLKRWSNKQNFKITKMLS